MADETPTPQKHFEKAYHNYMWAHHLFTLVYPQQEGVAAVSEPFDWVTTMAYYSARHYLAGYLLEKDPNVTSTKGKPRHYKCIDDAAKDFGISKHAAAQEIVRCIAYQIKAEWKYLYNNADTARYKVNGVSKGIAEEALKALDVVKGRFFIAL